MGKNHLPELLCPQKWQKSIQRTPFFEMFKIDVSKTLTLLFSGKSKIRKVSSVLANEEHDIYKIFAFQEMHPRLF